MLSSGGRVMVVMSQGSIICITREYFWGGKNEKSGG